MALLPRFSFLIVLLSLLVLVSSGFDCFLYQRSLTLINPDPTLHDGDTMLIYDTAALISSDLLSSNCSDLRIRLYGTIWVDLWLETPCNSVDTKIWFNSTIPGMSNITADLFANCQDPMTNDTIMPAPQFGSLLDWGGLFYSFTLAPAGCDESSAWTLLQWPGGPHETARYAKILPTSSDEFFVSPFGVSDSMTVHSHTPSTPGTLTSSSVDGGWVKFGYTGGWPPILTSAHTHVFNPTNIVVNNSVNTWPPSVSEYLCTSPTNLLSPGSVIFAKSSSPSPSITDFVRVEAFDDRLIRATEYEHVRAVEDWIDNTHEHNVVEISPAFGTSYSPTTVYGMDASAVDAWGCFPDNTVNPHPHPMGTFSISGSGTTLPTRKEVVFYSATRLNPDLEAVGSYRFLVDSIPPFGYKRDLDEEFSGAFLIGSSSPSASKMSGSHSHPEVRVPVQRYGSGCGCVSYHMKNSPLETLVDLALAAHDHYVDGLTWNANSEANDKLPRWEFFMVERLVSSIQVVLNPISCYGVPPDDVENTCSGHGNCIEEDTCVCRPPGQWMGFECSTPVCDGKTNQDFPRDVCENRGYCIGGNLCDCNETSTFTGPLCSHPICYGLNAYDNASTVCSGRGECVAPDTCECDWVLFGYNGSTCDTPVCVGNLTNDDYPNQCNGRGSCLSPGLCNCNRTSEYVGPDCDVPICFGKNAYEQNASEVCSGRGTCVAPDECLCDWELLGFNGSMCDKPVCVGNLTNEADPLQCNGRGYCLAPNLCRCNRTNEYVGSDCDVPICYGVNSLENEASSICSAHGSCVGPNQCACSQHWFGEYCNVTICDSVLSNDTRACSGHGICESPDSCSCDLHYNEDLDQFCGITTCGTFTSDDSNVCNGHGQCVSFGECNCDSSSFDSTDFCTPKQYTVELVAGVAGGVSFIGLVLGFLVLLCVFICCVRYYKQSRDDGLGSGEGEIEVEANQFAKLVIDASVFNIPFHELKTGALLGKGGSGSMVYRATWHNEEVALKLIRLDSYVSQTALDDFTQEIEMMKTLNHPYVIRFFGATAKMPKIGMVIQLCPGGDLKVYLQTQERLGVLLSTRIRLLTEVANGMKYLHSKNVIHRDLKCQNCLVDDSDSIKIMDFGLSRQDSENTKTRGVGTAYYMAPEMIRGEVYSFPVDVFSFGIMLFEVLNIDFRPYGTEVDFVEFKVGADPNFRPDSSRFEADWMRDLAEKCWSHESSARPTFEEIAEELAHHEETATSSEGILLYIVRMGDDEDQAEDVRLRERTMNALRDACLEKWPNVDLRGFSVVGVVDGMSDALLFDEHVRELQEDDMIRVDVREYEGADVEDVGVVEVVSDRRTSRVVLQKIDLKDQ